jgi:selenocysteine-specific elongation factor
MHVIGTAGHVDHGKSSLVQRLTGIDPDRFEEEKRRGLTIDLGFAWLQLPSGREVGIVDVPGHERFVKNMLAGAGGVNVCLFVVAATEGWKPQSAEHLAILDVLGVRHGVVALTKADLVDDDALELARLEVAEKLTDTSLSGAPVVACSSVTGFGLDVLVTELDRVLASAPPAIDRGRPRLWVDRVFTIAGAGTVVTGTLAGGSFALGDEVSLVGRDGTGRERVRRARIRKIQSHKKELSSVGPGNRVALNLAGLEREGAARGDAVVGSGAPGASGAPGSSVASGALGSSVASGAWPTTSRIDAMVRVLDASVSGTSHELTDKGAHLLYSGSAETPVRVKLLSARSLASGESGFAQLHLRDPLPLARGDRFVLRDAGRVVTFGGGTVLDPGAGPARRSGDDRLRLLAALAEGVDDEDLGAPGALEALVSHFGRLTRSEALWRSGSMLLPEGVAVLGGDAFSRERLTEVHAQLRTALSRHHEAHPLEVGMDREAARSSVGLEAGAFDDLISSMDEVGSEGAAVRLSTHEVSLDPQEDAARRELLARLDTDGFTPPFTKELGVDPALLRALSERGDVVRIGDFYLSVRRAEEARAKVRSRIESGGPVTVAQIRDLLGTSRKYAVPLCEWLDATGATRRQGDLRSLGPRP